MRSEILIIALCTTQWYFQSIRYSLLRVLSLSIIEAIQKKIKSKTSRVALTVWYFQGGES